MLAEVTATILSVEFLGFYPPLFRNTFSATGENTDVPGIPGAGESDIQSVQIVFLSRQIVVV